MANPGPPVSGNSAFATDLNGASAPSLALKFKYAERLGKRVAEDPDLKVRTGVHGREAGDRIGEVDDNNFGKTHQWKP